MKNGLNSHGHHGPRWWHQQGLGVLLSKVFSNAQKH